MIQRILEKWDNEENEFILRYRIWLSRWFPYRTAEFLGIDEKEKMILGPWKWNKPDILRGNK